MGSSGKQSSSNLSGKYPLSPRIFAAKLRRLAFGLFTLLSLAAPAVVFLKLRQGQYDIFEDGFDALSDQIVTGVANSLKSNLFGIDSLSVQATSDAMKQQEQLLEQQEVLSVNGTTPDILPSWPFYTFRDFGLQGASALALTGALALTFSPLVQHEIRDEWENFTTNNLDWLWEGLEYSSAFANPDIPHANGDLDNGRENMAVEPHIYKLDPKSPDGKSMEEYEGAGSYYFPAWQSAPLDPAVINYNSMCRDAPKSAIEHMIESGNAVLGRIERHVTLVFPSLRYTELLRGYQEDAPVSNIYYPVFDSFDWTNRNLVAMLSSTIYWPALFDNILPLGSNGITVVVENKCGDILTFQINGENTVFMGYQDGSDKAFAKYEHEFDFATIVKSSQIDDSARTAALSPDFCSYVIRISPSPELLYAYVDYSPYVFAGAVFLFFLIVGSMAIAYDKKIQRILRQVQHTEKQAQTIVKAYFPTVIRDRLKVVGVGRKGNEMKSIDVAHAISPKQRLTDYLYSSRGRKTEGMQNTTNLRKNSDSLEAEVRESLAKVPIAELFLDCTVLFADISGTW